MVINVTMKKLRNEGDRRFKMVVSLKALVTVNKRREVRKRIKRQEYEICQNFLGYNSIYLKDTKYLIQYRNNDCIPYYRP